MAGRLLAPVRPGDGLGTRRLGHTIADVSVESPARSLAAASSVARVADGASARKRPVSADSARRRRLAQGLSEVVADWEAEHSAFSEAELARAHAEFGH